MKQIKSWHEFRQEIVSLSTIELKRNPTLAELLAAAPPLPAQDEDSDGDDAA